MPSRIPMPGRKPSAPKPKPTTTAAARRAAYHKQLAEATVQAPTSEQAYCFLQAIKPAVGCIEEIGVTCDAPGNLDRARAQLAVAKMLDYVACCTSAAGRAMPYPNLADWLESER